MGSASAHQGKVHCSEMLQVLGVDRTRSHYQALQSLAETVTNTADKDWDKLLTELNSDIHAGHLDYGERNFSLGPSGHRLFYHWGFNAKPENQPLLREQVSQAVEKQHLMIETRLCQGEDITLAFITEDNLWQVINQAWEERRARAIEKARELVKSPQQAEALALIMFDVHILGDYDPVDNKIIEPLAKPEELAKEIAASIGKLGCKDRKKSEATVRLVMNAAKNADRQVAASKILEILKFRLPSDLAESSLAPILK